MTLTQAQQAAVTRQGQDVCVVAGPGSGKTRVLVERFASLMRNGVPASRILTITFTEKAAQEIKQRLARRFADNPETLREVAQAPVSTIHGFCLSFLKANAIAAGLDPDFRLLDEVEALALQSAALEAALDRMATTQREKFRALAATWSAFEAREPILSVYDAVRAAGGLAELGRLAEVPSAADALRAVRETLKEAIAAQPRPFKATHRDRVDALNEWLAAEAGAKSPLAWLDSFSCSKTGLKGHPLYDVRDRVQDELIPAARRAWATERFSQERGSLRTIVLDFHAEYLARKRTAALLDFGDLEEVTLRLLEDNSRLRQETSSRFQAILMDELQDTNPVQWQLLEKLRRPDRFFAVGDVNQSIYGFRHAEPRLFLTYQQSLERDNLSVDRLETNYRSRAEILEATQRMTGGQSGIQPHQLLRGREFDEKREPPVEILRVETPDTEPLWVAQRIGELVNAMKVGVADEQRPLQYSDIAVLARNSVVFSGFEEAFQRAGIPYVLKRGRNFFDESEIVDLTNWLRLFADPEDRLAWLGVLRSPFFSLGDDALMLGTLGGAMVPEAARQVLERAKARLADEPVDRVLLELVDSRGYALTLDPLARGNVDKFLVLLRRWERDEPGNVTAWLNQLQDLRALGREPNAPLVYSANAVQMMTIHVAKGLEFPVVFVASMHKGTSFSRPALIWSPQMGLGGSWRDISSEETVGDTAYSFARERLLEREKEEADRLLYVAMTRAEEHLVLSYEHQERSRAPWPQLAEKNLVAAGFRLTVRHGTPELVQAEVPGGDAARGTDVVRLAPLPAILQPPATLPVTAAAEFETCPRRYFLSSVVRWPKPEVAATSATETGRIVHELLAGKIVAGASEEQRWMAERFLQSPLGKRAAGAPVREREWGISFAVGETILEGTIDLYFEDEAGGVLVDYKTDRRLGEEARASYERQLQFYSLALAKQSGTPPQEVYLFLLRRAEAVLVMAGPDELGGLADLLEQIREAHRRKDFPLRVGNQCRRCPYLQNGCPAVIEPVEETQVDGALDFWA